MAPLPVVIDFREGEEVLARFLAGGIATGQTYWSCPKCNGEIVQGFTCGREGPNRVLSTWVEGAPEMVGRLFRQVRKVPRDKCVPVGIFRCSACGFLESYARPEFAAK